MPRAVSGFHRFFRAGLAAGLLSLAFCPAAASDSSFEIEVRLTGQTDYPGLVVFSANEQRLDTLCLLGREAKGNVDGAFLEWLAAEGIPEGVYRVAAPVAEERWPVAEFVRADALRLEVVKDAEALRREGRRGVAIHGRDFYPLLMPVIPDKKMIRFYDGQLFQRLKRHWGPLRLSNWDMNRLFDFWNRHTVSPEQWNARVVRADPERVRAKCKPPVVKRKADE